MKRITKLTLRYVYPLYFEETLDRATPKIDRYEKPNRENSWKYERTAFSDIFPEPAEIFPFAADSFFAETGDKGGIGRSWSMKKGENRYFLSTRFTAKVGKEEEAVTVGITKINLCLTRMHTGLFWIEMELSAEKITSGILLDFQKNLIEANPFKEWIAEWVSPLSCRFVPEIKTEEKSLPVRPFCFTVCVGEESTEGERKKLKESLSEDGIAFVYGKQEEMSESVHSVDFLLLLRSMYRMYASLYYLEQIRRTVSAAREDYEPITEKDEQKRAQKEKRRNSLLFELQKLRTDLALFLTVNPDGPVSPFPQHNEFDRLCRERFGLAELKQTMETSRSTVGDLIGHLEETIREEEEEKRKVKEAEREEEKRQEEELKQSSGFRRFGKRN